MQPYNIFAKEVNILKVEDKCMIVFEKKILPSESERLSQNNTIYIFL